MAVSVLARTPQQALVPLLSVWKLKPESRWFAAVAPPGSLLPNTSSGRSWPR